MAFELIKLQKQIALQTADIDFRMDHMFRVEIDNQPKNLELFVKDVAYGKGTIESDSILVGSGEFNRPSKRTAGSVTVTFLDNEKGEISQFIESLQDKIFNKDGSGNVPIDYLFNIRVYRILNDASEYLEFEKEVYCEENNDYKSSVDAVTERGTFNATFKKYSSIGDGI